MIEETYGDRRLSSYDSVELILPDFAVSDEAVDEEVGRIASRHASTVTVDPRPIQPGDLVRICIETSESGHPFPGLTNKGVDVRLGVGALPRELEDGLTGHMPGDVVEVCFAYEDPATSSSTTGDVVGSSCCQDAVTEGEGPRTVELFSHVEVVGIRQLHVPELTDEWVRANIALSNSVGEFRDRTRRRLLEEKRRRHASRVEQDVIAEMGTRLVNDPPNDAVESLSEQLSKEFDAFLKQYDMDRTAYLATQSMTEDQLIERIRQDAYDRVSQDIALAAYACHYGIGLEDCDVDAMFSQPTPEKTYEARKRAEQTGEIAKIRDLALRAKAAEAATRRAVFKAFDGDDDGGFSVEVERRYEKLRAVRDHATSAPLLRRVGSR